MISGTLTPGLVFDLHVDGSVQDCSNSNADALELLQSCTKPPIQCPFRVDRICMSVSRNTDTQKETGLIK